MQRRDKHGEHWEYATDSGDEDSTSCYIPSSDIPSSEDSQYKVERLKKQLDQQQSSEEESDNEEGDSNFPTSGKIKFRSSGVI